MYVDKSIYSDCLCSDGDSNTILQVINMSCIKICIDKWISLCVYVYAHMYIYTYVYICMYIYIYESVCSDSLRDDGD
jgi:hypothetical protein